MRVLIIDDELPAIEVLKRAVENELPNCDIVTFSYGKDAIAFARNNKVDVAFCDIQMPEISGIDLAQELLKTNSEINIIFATGYDNYGIEAVKLHASGYITKPIKRTDVKNVLENLLHPIKEEKRIVAKFENGFDLYVDGKIVNFRRKTSKEILSYLISKNGNAVTRKELADVLFPQQEYTRAKQTYISQLITALEDTLQSVDAQDLFVKDYNCYYINNALVECK